MKRLPLLAERSYYGLIPERVETITSVTPKRSRRFFSPLASFSYEHLPAKAYAVGINLEQIGGIGVLIASREKALCDRVALTANIRTITEIGQYIVDNLRIDPESISGLSANLLENITHAYDLQSVKLLMRWFGRISEGGTTK